MSYYTGIGHRDTPLQMKSYIQSIAKRLLLLEYTLRSGGAQGADSFFESGAGKNKEIYLPWKGFNDNMSKLYDIDDKSYIVVEDFFNSWKHAKAQFFDLKDGTQKLFIRNYYQLMGYQEDPSDFVIYYADTDQAGHPMGGTGFAIHMANQLGIPSFNIKDAKGIQQVNSLILKMKVDYIYKMMRHYHLFYGEQIEKEDDKRIEELVDLDLSVFYKNISLRNILEKYFIKYHKKLKDNYFLEEIDNI